MITIFDHPFFGTVSLHSVLINKLQNEEFNGIGLYFMRLNPNIRQRIAEFVVTTLNPEVESEAA